MESTMIWLGMLSWGLMGLVVGMPAPDATTSSSGAPTSTSSPANTAASTSTTNQAASSTPSTYYFPPNFDLTDQLDNSRRRMLSGNPDSWVVDLLGSQETRMVSPTRKESPLQRSLPH